LEHDKAVVKLTPEHVYCPVAGSCGDLAPEIPAVLHAPRMGALCSEPYEEVRRLQSSPGKVRVVNTGVKAVLETTSWDDGHK